MTYESLRISNCADPSVRPRVVTFHHFSHVFQNPLPEKNTAVSSNGTESGTLHLLKKENNKP